MDSVDSASAKSHGEMGNLHLQGCLKQEQDSNIHRSLFKPKSKSDDTGIARWPLTHPCSHSQAQVPPSCTSLLTQGAQGHVTMGFECLQGWRLCGVSGQPMSDHPQGQKVFSYVWTRFHVFWLVLVASCPVTGPTGNPICICTSTSKAAAPETQPYQLSILRASVICPSLFMHKKYSVQHSVVCLFTSDAASTL